MWILDLLQEQALGCLLELGRGWEGLAAGEGKGREQRGKRGGPCKPGRDAGGCGRGAVLPAQRDAQAGSKGWRLAGGVLGGGLLLGFCPDFSSLQIFRELLLSDLELLFTNKGASSLPIRGCQEETSLPIRGHVLGNGSLADAWP